MATVHGNGPLSDLLEAFPDGWLHSREERPEAAPRPLDLLQGPPEEDAQRKGSNGEASVDDLIAGLLLPTFPEVPIDRRQGESSEAYAFPSLEGWTWQEMAGEGRTLQDCDSTQMKKPAAKVALEKESLRDLLIDFDEVIESTSSVAPEPVNSTPASPSQALPNKSSSPLLSASPSRVTYNYTVKPAGTILNPSPGKDVTSSAPYPPKGQTASLGRPKNAQPQAQTRDLSPPTTRSISIAGRAQRGRERMVSDDGLTERYDPSPFKRFVDARKAELVKEDEWTDEEEVSESMRPKGWRTDAATETAIKAPSSPSSPQAPASPLDHSPAAQTKPSTAIEYMPSASVHLPAVVTAQPQLPPVEGIETGWRAIPHEELRGSGDSAKRTGRGIGGTSVKRRDSSARSSEPSHFVEEDDALGFGYRGGYGTAFQGRGRGRGGVRDSYRPNYDAHPRATYRPRRDEDVVSSQKFSARIVYPHHARKSQRPSDASEDDNDHPEDEGGPDAPWIRHRNESDWKRNDYNDSWEMQRQGISGRFNKRNRELQNAW